MEEDLDNLLCSEDLFFDLECSEFQDSSSFHFRKCDSCSPFGVQGDCYELSLLLRSLAEKELDSLPDFRNFSQSYPCLGFQLRDLRKEAILLIIKISGLFSFTPVTISLAVNYFDRYLSKNTLQEWKQWMVELMAIGCLSIAAKMEEVHVPPLTDFQVIGIGHVLTPFTAQRMELSVLKSLEWRMNAVTVFTYLDPVAQYLNIEAQNASFLISRVSELLLAALTEVEFLEFRPSTVLLSAMLCAFYELMPLQAFSHVSQLSVLFDTEQDKLKKCHRFMEEMIADPISPCATPVTSKLPRSPATVFHKFCNNSADSNQKL